jgi:hypothetical protein
LFISYKTSATEKNEKIWKSGKIVERMSKRAQKSQKTRVFAFCFEDNILHNFDDIFILNLLKLLHLRKIARSHIQGGTTTNFILRCLHNITSHDRCIIWLTIYIMKKILRALGWIELNSAKIIIFVINILWSSVIVGGKQSIPTTDKIAGFG